MFNFKMAPFAYVIYNNEQIMYIPEDADKDFGWNDLKVRYSGKESKIIEILDDKDEPLFIVGNPEMFLPMLRSKEHYIGWTEDGTLKNREIRMDITGLLKNTAK